MPSRAYVGAFNFKGSDQQKKVGILSGGERNRVHLAKMLKPEHNVILLDEPTNDLDVDTLRALEDALIEFAGCAVIISHDRWFLDRLATHILAFEGDSHVEWFEGNFEAYEEDKRRRLGAAAGSRTGSSTGRWRGEVDATARGFRPMTRGGERRRESARREAPRGAHQLKLPDTGDQTF